MITVENGLKVYHGDTFKIVLRRYSDPHRLNAAYNAAKYLGKKDTDNIRRPLRIIRDGHVPEIFRGEMAEFEFIDVSKEVYDHLVTYRTMNMRVAGGNRALTSDDYTMPSDRMKDPELVRDCIESSLSNYLDLLEAGETPQVARAAMPVNAKLNPFVLQFNFLTLGQALFKQRIWEKGAQGNTVKVVQGMFELVHSVDPELWDTFYEWYGTPATEWVEVRRKLKKKRITLDDFIGEINSDAYELWKDKPLEDFLKALYGQQKSMWD
jgi:Thymidylate synthase complementing protein